MPRMQDLLDTGMLLLFTAKRFDRDSVNRANCLDGAKTCQLRVEENMWKFQEPLEFAHLTAGLQRLYAEITALG